MDLKEEIDLLKRKVALLEKCAELEDKMTERVREVPVYVPVYPVPSWPNYPTTPWPNYPTYTYC
jgi:hypothetical protein